MKFHHFSITVPHLPSAIQFYQNVFQAKILLYLEEWEEKIAFIQIDTLTIELIEDASAEEKVNDRHLCFQVDDIHSIASKLEKFEMFLLEGPYELKNGWTTVFYQGKHGEIIEFFQIKKS
mgnify:CR=1 FL=1